MIKIAITGNIASGKSQIEAILTNMGYTVFDTDKIAHLALEKIEHFDGYDVFTQGKIDRKKLGKLVFENPDLKLKLENIIHPIVKSEIMKIFEMYSENKLIFISVPLLFETDFHALFDKTIIVTTNEDIRLKRLMNRNNLTKEEALLRIKAQKNEQEKIHLADYVIENNSTLENAKEQLVRILKKITS